MVIVFFFLDTIVFLAIVGTLVSLATAAAVLLSGAAPTFLRFILPLVAFIISLILGALFAFDVVLASIPSGRWLNLLLLILVAPVMMPLIWSAVQYSRRNLGDN